MSRLYPATHLVTVRDYMLISEPDPGTETTIILEDASEYLGAKQLTPSTLKRCLDAGEAWPLWPTDDATATPIGKKVSLECPVTAGNAARFCDSRGMLVELMQTTTFRFGIGDEPQFVTKDIQLLPGDEKRAILAINIYGRMIRFIAHYVDADWWDGKLGLDLGECHVRVDADRSGSLDFIEATRSGGGLDADFDFVAGCNHTN